MFGNEFGLSGFRLGIPFGKWICFTILPKPMYRSLKIQSASRWCNLRWDVQIPSNTNMWSFVMLWVFWYDLIEEIISMRDICATANLRSLQLDKPANERPFATSWVLHAPFLAAKAAGNQATPAATGGDHNARVCWSLHWFDANFKMLVFFEQIVLVQKIVFQWRWTITKIVTMENICVP